MNNSPATMPRPVRGRRYLALGLVLPALGIIGYVVQLWMERLRTPWYVPILGTLGVLFLIASLRQKRTIWRILALLLVVLLAGAEWSFLWLMRLPAYTGPVAVGQPFPAFTTRRADGTPFTERDLAGSQDNVFVFYRGHW